MSVKQFLVLGVLALTVAVFVPREAAARVRLENICTIYGQKEVRLTGIGLVVGLNKTGDGGSNQPAMRALAGALQRMHNPVMDLKELRDANNVAMVLIEATVPRTGLRAGQKIDCYVSSTMGAKSLRGGRLLAAPLTTAEVGSDVVMGVASGPVYIEDPDVQTTGKIPGGLVLERDVVSLFVDRERGHVVTLLLDAAHSSFHAASEVSHVINQEFSSPGRRRHSDLGPRTSGGMDGPMARAVGPGVIEVRVPEEYHDSPVEFIAEVLEVGIDNPHTQARVVVNAKTGTVIVTGEVELSPVVISHKNLTVQVGGDAGGPAAPNRFVPIADSQGRQSPQQLQQLVESLNELRVPTQDVIAIIRELHRSGKLHAAYEEH